MQATPEPELVAKRTVISQEETESAVNTPLEESSEESVEAPALQPIHDMYIYIQTEILPNLNHGTCGYVGSAFVFFTFQSQLFFRTGICSEKSVLGCWVSLNLGLSAIRGKDIRENECWVVGSAFFKPAFF